MFIQYLLTSLSLSLFRVVILQEKNVYVCVDRFLFSLPRFFYIPILLFFFLGGSSSALTSNQNQQQLYVFLVLPTSSLSSFHLSEKKTNF